jgi:hypothetical protein
MSRKDAAWSIGNPIGSLITLKDRSDERGSKRRPSPAFQAGSGTPHGERRDTLPRTRGEGVYSASLSTSNSRGRSPTSRAHTHSPEILRGLPRALPHAPEI